MTDLIDSPFSKQENEKGFVTGEGRVGTPQSLPELERPPLRKIDQYILPDCPCCNMTKRFTVAILASIGKMNITLSLPVAVVLCLSFSCLYTSTQAIANSVNKFLIVWVNVFRYEMRRNGD